MSTHPEFGIGVMDVPSFGASYTVTNELVSQNEAAYENMRLLHEPGWENNVSRVVVLLSASRSGSSLMFDALANGNDVVAPAGEHEPWLYLTANKWPFTTSDGLSAPKGRDKLLTLIRNDLLVRNQEVQGQELGDLMWNRAVVRQVNASPHIRNVVHSLGKLARVDRPAYRKASELLNGETTKLSPVICTEDVYDESRFVPAENPPFIDQPFARRATSEELAAKTLLFKSPPDTYRRGLYEGLFPNADITYVHLTRGFAQTVNGLMDGWSKDEVAFISNAIGLSGDKLQIADYSKGPVTDAYWCFDLFPSWTEHTSSSLLEVCVQQWLHAHRRILEDFRISDQVKFESFYTDRNALQQKLQKSTGISLGNHDWAREVMTTDKPGEFRWRKRADIFHNLGRYLTASTVGAVKDVQTELGYSMEESTWH